MKSMFLPKIICLCLACLLLATGSFARSWKIMSGYSIRFSTRAASGNITGLSGTINFDPANYASGSFDVQVAVNTISTGSKKKDKDAKSEDWFDALKYPSIHFVSKSIQKTASGYQVTGTLTMHGVSLDLAIPFTFSEQGNHGLFSGKFSVTREDYKVKGPAFRNALVGSDIEVNLTVPVEG